jgi:coenzyme F420-reducing hydrogenase gamma subunit
MKKILFAIFAVAALALTSCEGTKVSILDIDASQLDNTEYKCWKWTVKKSGFMDGTVYVWDTEYNVVVVLQKAYKTAQLNHRKPMIGHYINLDFLHSSVNYIFWCIKP